MIPKITPSVPVPGIVKAPGTMTDAERRRLLNMTPTDEGRFLYNQAPPPTPPKPPSVVGAPTGVVTRYPTQQAPTGVVTRTPTQSPTGLPGRPLLPSVPKPKRKPRRVIPSNFY